MNNRTIAKVCFAIAGVSGIVMAVYGWAESFSQNALTDHDGWLSAYLVFGGFGFCFLCADATNRNSLVRIFWTSKIQWGYVFLWLAFAFAAVRITNVWQMRTPHLISTAAIILGASVLPMNQKGFWRWIGYGYFAAALYYFWQTFQNGLHTIAWGELALTGVAFLLAWIIINEKIDK